MEKRDDGGPTPFGTGGAAPRPGRALLAQVGGSGAAALLRTKTLNRNLRWPRRSQISLTFPLEKVCALQVIAFFFSSNERKEGWGRAAPSCSLWAWSQSSRTRAHLHLTAGLNRRTHTQVNEWQTCGQQEAICGESKCLAMVLTRHGRTIQK